MKEVFRKELEEYRKRKLEREQGETKDLIPQEKTENLTRAIKIAKQIIADKEQKLKEGLISTGIEADVSDKFLNLTTYEFEDERVENYKLELFNKTLPEKISEILKLIEKAHNYAGILLPDKFDTEALLILARLLTGPITFKIYVVNSLTLEAVEFDFKKIVSYTRNIYLAESGYTGNIYAIQNAHAFDIFCRMFRYDPERKIFGMHPITKLPASIQVSYEYAQIFSRLKSEYLMLLFPEDCKIKYLGAFTEQDLSYKSKILWINTDKLYALFRERLGIPVSQARKIFYGISFKDKPVIYKKYVEYVRETIYKELPDKIRFETPYPETYEEYLTLNKKIKYNCKEIEKDLKEKLT